MQPGIERRAPDATRVPLDLWVRLSHEDFDDAFDADGVDLSPGGLALRSDFLPEVGDRLRCRFDCPPEGGALEVDGEVVWAHDAGERSGEFGLRFATLDEGAEASLRRLVEHLGGEPGARGSVRLHLDGVSTPIEAEITDRDDEWMTVEQELPFLRIGMGVAVEGPNAPPRGRLASVDLRLEDGTPRLVLGVERARAEVDTLDEPAEQAITLDDEAAEGDATVQDFELPAELRDAEAAVAEVVGRSVDARPARSETDEDEASMDEASMDAVGAPRGAGVDPGSHVDARSGAVRRADDASVDPDAAPEAAPEPGLAGVAQRLRPLWAQARVRTEALAEKAKPALAAFWAKVVAVAAVVAKTAGPRAKAVFGALAAASKGLFAKLAGTIGKKGKRRTTAAPRRRVAQSPKLRRQREEAAAQAAPSNKKRNRRVVLLSVLAFAGVGTAVYALSGGDEEAAEATEATLPAEPAAEEPEAVDPEAGDVVEPTEASPASETDEGAEAEEAPAAQAGRLGEPTYPSLSDAAERREAPVEEGTSFGADEVEDPRSATLNMSQPVTTLRGQRTDDGFTVTIPGSLSLDPAGPIAARNPLIERATILNRGDHSVLTVRFVAGRSPDYRVIARDRAIEIQIGR